MQAGFLAYGRPAFFLLTAPSRRLSRGSGIFAAFVPDHSNGWHAMALHHLSF